MGRGAFKFFVGHPLKKKKKNGGRGLLFIIIFSYLFFYFEWGCWREAEGELN